MKMLCFMYKNIPVQASVSVLSKRAALTPHIVFSSLNSLHPTKADSLCTLQRSRTKGKRGEEPPFIWNNISSAEGGKSFPKAPFPTRWKQESCSSVWTGRSRASRTYSIHSSLDLFEGCLQYNNIYLEERKSVESQSCCRQLKQISFLLKETWFNLHWKRECAALKRTVISAAGDAWHCGN